MTQFALELLTASIDRKTMAGLDPRDIECKCSTPDLPVSFHEECLLCHPERIGLGILTGFKLRGSLQRCCFR